MLSNDMLELPTVAQLVRAASSEPEGGRSSEDGACGMLVARRYFVDAVKLNKQDTASIRAVQLMDILNFMLKVGEGAFDLSRVDPPTSRLDTPGGSFVSSATARRWGGSG